MPGNEGSRRDASYRVIRAQEDERKRLARDLHDGLVQSLVGIGLNLEVAERHVAANPVQRPEALALLARVRDGLASCLEEARRILNDLRPLDLAGRSLAQALKDYAEKTSAEAGLKVTVVISGQDLRLAPELEAGLFRIYQEALANVREHAQASEVSLRLRFLPRSVAMDITDDGTGFAWDGDLKELIHRRCFGLVGIDERVRLLGGTWRVSTRPGSGTEVRVRLPVESRGGLWSFLPQRGGADRRVRAETPETGGAAPARTLGGPTAVTAAGPQPRGRGPLRGEPAVRVVVADDHRLVREGLKMLLELVQGVEIVGEAGDGDAAVTLCRDLTPDVILLDLLMPGPGGAEVTSRIRRAAPRTAVVVLTAYHEPERVRETVAAGAAGYLLKTANVDEIVGAIRAASAGLRPLAPEAVRALATEESTAGAVPAAPAEAPPPLLAAAVTDTPAEELTLREREVLVLVGEGLTNREISRRLYISDKTVRNHLGAIIRKLGLSDRTQVALAARGLRPAGRSEEG